MTDSAGHEREEYGTTHDVARRALSQSSSAGIVAVSWVEDCDDDDGGKKENGVKEGCHEGRGVDVESPPELDVTIEWGVGPSSQYNSVSSQSRPPADDGPTSSSTELPQASASHGGVVAVSFYCTGYGPSPPSSSSIATTPDPSFSSPPEPDDSSSPLPSNDIYITVDYDVYTPEQDDDEEEWGSISGRGGGREEDGQREEDDLKEVTAQLDRKMLDFLVPELGLQYCLRRRRARGRGRRRSRRLLRSGRSLLLGRSAAALPGGRLTGETFERGAEPGATMMGRREAAGSSARSTSGLVGLSIFSGGRLNRVCASPAAEAAAILEVPSSCASVRGHVRASFAVGTPFSAMEREAVRIQTLLDAGFDSGEFAEAVDGVGLLVYRPPPGGNGGAGDEDGVSALVSGDGGGGGTSSEPSVTNRRGGGGNGDGGEGSGASPSAGAVAGIAAGGIGMLLAASIFAVVVIRRRRKRETKNGGVENRGPATTNDRPLDTTERETRTCMIDDENGGGGGDALSTLTPNSSKTEAEANHHSPTRAERAKKCPVYESSPAATVATVSTYASDDTSHSAAGSESSPPVCYPRLSSVDVDDADADPSVLMPTFAIEVQEEGECTGTSTMFVPPR